MVVGNDVAVLADDYSGTAALLGTLGSLSLIAEEEAEEGVDVLLLAGFDCDLDINYGVHCILCGEGEVWIVGK